MGEPTCVRLFLIGINVIVLLCGLAILGIGTWVQIEKGDYVALAESDTGLTGAILIIAVGVASTLISALGLFGAIKKNVIALWIFFAIVDIVIIIEIVAVLLGMIYQDKIEDELHSDMKKSVAEYSTDVEGVTDAWDWVQEKFECCGVDNYTSWRLSANFNKAGSHKLVPDSCCKNIKSGCGNQTTSSGGNVDTSTIHTRGCFKELKDYVKDHLLKIGLSALVFLIIQLIVVILTLIMVLKLKKE